MPEKKKRTKRWQKTEHVGISVDKEGHILVRAAIKRSGKTRELKRVLNPPATMADALLAHAELKYELAGGSQRPARTSMLDFAEHWLEDVARINRPRVAEVYLQTLRDHVLPEIGHAFVDEFTRDQVKKMTHNWVDKRRDDGKPYSKSTVQAWWKVARNLIADACAEHRISHSPTERVRLPRMQRTARRERRTLTAGQVVQLLDFVERAQPRRYAEVALLALGGFRPSEVFALMPADVNLTTGEVTIERSVDRGHVDAPKTERSNRDGVDARRVVVVPERAIEAVRLHRKWLMAGRRPGPTGGLLFPSRRGTHRTPASLRKTFAAAEAYLKLDIRVGPQVLRRTYNTLMKDLTDIVTLHAQMGHSDERMTELYAHVDYETKRRAVTDFEALLERAATG